MNNKSFTKQMIIFICISIASILLLNMTIMPMLNKSRIKETNYSFFLDMLDENKIKQVKVESSEIRFEVEEDGKKQVYSTARMNDPDLVDRDRKSVV